MTFATRKSYNVQTRRIENAHELADACTAWGATQKKLPKGKKRVVCEEYSFEDHSQADVLKQMMRTDALVGEYSLCASVLLIDILCMLGYSGAGLVNGWFMMPGSSIIEVRPLGYIGGKYPCSGWPVFDWYLLGYVFRLA